MNIKSVLFLLALLTSRIVNSQSYTFSNYSIAQGLAQTQVTAITEDKNGYLWVGTLGGLSCFNGSTFKNYSSEDSLLNIRITCLYSNQDQLWIGHRGGISCYHKRKFKHWAFGKKKNQIDVSDMIFFDGKLIITTNGDGIYTFKGGKLRHISLPGEDQNRIRNVELHKGKLYFATRSGLLVSSNLNDFAPIEVGFELSLTDVINKQEYLILSDINGSIYQYHPEYKKITTIHNFGEGEIVYTKDCFLDSKNNLWLANFLGLSFIKPNQNAELIDQTKGLTFSTLNCVFEDKNGTYWIGSDGKGLFRFAGTQMKYYNLKNGIQSDLVTSVGQLPNKEMWFGTYDAGLIYYTKNMFTPFDLPNNTVWAICRDILGNQWVGSTNGLFRVRHKGNQNQVMESFARDKKTNCFFEEKNRDILVGGSFGIWRIRKGVLDSVSASFNQQEWGTVRNIVEYQRRIICATDAGVFEFKSGRFIPIFNLKQRVHSLKVDPMNNLWIGCEDGFYWSDGKELKQVTLSNLPASNFINFINSDGKQLFVGTNNGLFVLSNLQQKEKANIQHYGIEEGLINLETNINSSFFDSDGNFWFGTAEGLMKYDLSESNQNKYDGIPHLNVSAIKINFQDFDYSKYSKQFDAFGIPSELTLPPTKNNIVVELDGVILKNYKSLNYEYWLEGLDEHWSPPFSSPYVTLSNMPSGSYKLHIRTINGTGKFSTEYCLAITILPVFYKTWWFILICLMALGLSIYGYFQYRINRERAKNYQETLEFKAKLVSLEQQSLNASMNRHFIFNSLNSIQYFINTQDKVSANKYLTNFAKLIRKNLDSSSEDNNLVTLNQEIERLELYLSLEAMRFNKRFDYVIDVGNIDLESITVPAMLFQPFVENSIIHGILPNTEKKGLISIRLRVEDSFLVVEIEDNGIGIDKSLTVKGLTSGDHRSQGMEITAKRIKLLSKITHKEYLLEGPFQLEDENRLINGTKVLLKIPLENLDD